MFNIFGYFKKRKQRKFMREKIYETLRETLVDVLRTNYDRVDEAGKPVKGLPDYELTCRMMRMKARQGLELLARVEGEKYKDYIYIYPPLKCHKSTLQKLKPKELIYFGGQK